MISRSKNTITLIFQPLSATLHCKQPQTWGGAMGQKSNKGKNMKNPITAGTIWEALKIAANEMQDPCSALTMLLSK